MIGATRQIWNPHRTNMLRVSVALLGLYAALKLGTEFWRLLFDESPTSAIDLRILNHQTRTCPGRCRDRCRSPRGARPASALPLRKAGRGLEFAGYRDTL